MVFGPTMAIRHSSFFAHWLPLCALVLIVLFPHAAAGQAPSVSSVVKFNAACVRCHEGECSGRLSFDSGLKAADTHIRRYAGDGLSSVSVRELFDLLRYMKTECSQYPLSIPIPPDRIWNEQTLEQLHSVSEKAYFVPLGPLGAGTYRVRLVFDTDTEVCTQLINATFDVVDHPPARTEKEAAQVFFVVPRLGEYFLRLFANNQARMVRLEIELVP